ncbi:MAG: hypothetical protein ABI690_17595 [Chloroflexota bacterium]
MLEGLSDIDWNELGAPEIPQQLHQLSLGYPPETADEFSGLFASLEEQLAPLMLLSGYGNYRDLMRIMETKIPHIVTPFLIQILDKTTDKRVSVMILELVHNECMYIQTVGTIVADREDYKAWARQLRDEVEKGMPVYLKLAHDSEQDVRQGTEDLLLILKDTK